MKNIILQVVWFKDGRPLMFGNRFSHTQDFGFVSLDIAYTVPEDQGVYTARAVNAQGQDEVSAQLNVQVS